MDQVLKSKNVMLKKTVDVSVNHFLGLFKMKRYIAFVYDST